MIIGDDLWFLLKDGFELLGNDTRGEPGPVERGVGMLIREE